jgi:anti-sigma factor RsiW
MTHALSIECRRVLASVSAYLDGDLETATCESIETHCRDCAGCAAVVAGLRETVGLCRQVGSRPVPNDVRQRALARVQRLLDEGQTVVDRNSRSS